MHRKILKSWQRNDTLKFDQNLVTSNGTLHLLIHTEQLLYTMSYTPIS